MYWFVVMLQKKPLNPNAPEWRPSPPPLLLLPHLIFHTHPPPPTLPPPPPPHHITFLKDERPHSERKAGTTRRAIPPRRQRAIAAAKRPPPPPRWVRKPEKPAFRRDPETPILPSEDDDALTTVMVKNIPNKLRRNFMLGFLDDCCKNHSLEYDFLYLPMDFRFMNNLGYAFVNFTSGDSARKFKRILHNYKWKDASKEITSNKICEITWARLQGKEAMVRRFRNSNFICSSLEFLPIVLEPPRNGLDPNPPPPVILGRLVKPPLCVNWF